MTDHTLRLAPDRGDRSRLDPERAADAARRARAERVATDRRRRNELWRHGFTRRRFLAGAGMAGVAGLAGQLVSTRVAFAAVGDTGALVVIFLRGGMDGLSVVVPADDPHLLEARPRIAVRASSLLPLDRGFGLHPALAPLHAHWKRGQFTAVPAVSTPDISRSHFQAQDCLERGGAGTGTTEGWLDRVLDRLGPGTTFRAVGQGPTLPRSLSGDQPSLSLASIAEFGLVGSKVVHDKSIQALKALYTGVDHPVGPEAAAALAALDTAERLRATAYAPAATYPDGDFAKGLSDLACLIKANVGLRVACIDVGGWDMHTNLGTVDGGDMQRMLTSLGQALAAFTADLGERLVDVTVITVTEFGRRIEQNANAGTDHGHGAVVLLLGGGLAGGTIHGNWQGLAPDVRDHGDVPGSNDYRDVLGEVVGARLGLGQGDLAAVFPGHRVRRIGVMR